MARLKPVWFLAVAMVFLLMAAYQGYAWYRTDRLNRAMLDPASSIVDETSPPELIFAKAWQLEQGVANRHDHPHYPNPSREPALRPLPPTGEGRDGGDPNKAAAFSDRPHLSSPVGGGTRNEAPWLSKTVPGGHSVRTEVLEAKGEQGCCDSNIEEAIRLYASLQRTDDKALRARVLYNLGTIYLKEGATLWNARGVLEYARVNTLVELAKEYYRDSLRLDPGNWDARYNLEYAWRITPPPKEKSKSDWRGSKSSVFSTLPGMPGGGP